MPRVQPTFGLEVIGNLDLSPEKIQGTLIESKHQNKTFANSKPPSTDSTGDQLELLAIHHEHEYRDMLKLQKEMVEHNRNQEIVNENRRKELDKLQDVLRGNFIKTNSFFKKCDVKKKMAESKILKERELHAELRENIQTYQNNLDVLTKFKKDLSATVKQFEPYEAVIQQVVDQSDVYSSVKDCMARCDALMTTQDELTKQKSEKLEQIDAIRLTMSNLVKQASLTVLGLNNYLLGEERAYYYACSDCRKWELMLVGIKNCLVSTISTNAKIITEISIVYRQLCNRRGLTPILKDDNIDGRMKFIKSEIEILQKVLQECQKI